MIRMSLRTPPILCSRQDRHFYFRLFLLLRKAINAITKLPKAISRANMPMKTEMISKAVICATSLLMYSGNPVIKHREISTLSRALSYGLRHANNISSPPSQFNVLLQFFLFYFFNVRLCQLFTDSMLSALILKLTLKVFPVIFDYLSIINSLLSAGSYRIDYKRK